MSILYISRCFKSVWKRQLIQEMALGDHCFTHFEWSQPRVKVAYRARWDRHHCLCWRLRSNEKPMNGTWEEASKQVKKAEEKQLVQPVDCHFHREGGSADTKLSSNTFFHSDALDIEHVELGWLGVQSRMIIFPFLFLSISTPYLLFKLEHSISDTLGLPSSKYPDLCLQCIHHQHLSWSLF